MEKDPNYIVAIDMGTSKVVALVGERSEDGKISIVASSCVSATGITRGDVKNIEQIVRSVNEAVNTISNDFGIKICEAYVGLSGQHIKCQDHEGYVFIVNSEGEVHNDDVVKLSKSMRNIQLPAGEVIIHILPKSYTIDDDTDINDPVGMIGSKLTGSFKIVTGIKRNMDLVGRSLSRADITITDSLLSSIASAEAVLVDDEKELGVAVIDIGGGTSDVCIHHDKTIRYLGVIPIGGNNINKDIKSYGILERHVEKLKVKCGSAMQSLVPENQVIGLPSINNSPAKEIPQKVLASIIEARMMDIIDKFKEMIAEAGFSRLPGGVVITGGGAMLKDVDKLFAKHLDCDVRIGLPTVYISDDSIEAVSDPKYSTAVGLLLAGMTLGFKTKTIVLNKPQPVAAPVPQHPVTRYQQPSKPVAVGGHVVKDNDVPPPPAPPTEPEPEPAKQPKKGGFGNWLRNGVDKVRDMFEADDEIEGNNSF